MRRTLRMRRLIPHRPNWLIFSRPETGLSLGVAGERAGKGGLTVAVIDESQLELRVLRGPTLVLGSRCLSAALRVSQDRAAGV